MKASESLQLLERRLVSPRASSGYPHNRVLKRAIDLGVCIVLLPVVLALMVVVCVLITLDSPLYSEEIALQVVRQKP